MVHSRAFEAEPQCPACGGAFRADIWAVIDVAERPDLVDRLCSGQLSTATCPHCGASVPLPEFLLVIYRPAEKPPIFVVSTDETPEEIREVGGMLLSGLREALGRERDGGLRISAPTMSRDRMTELLRLERESRLVTGPDLGDNALTELIATAREFSPVSNPSGFAFMHMAIGSQYSNAADQAIGLGCAIRHYRMAAASVTSEDSIWASAHISLSYAYVRCPVGDLAENADHAIEHAEAALTVLLEPAATRAQALTNLGLALIHRPHGDRVANFERAVAVLEEATAIFGAVGSPAKQAVVDVNLAHAYTMLPGGDTERNGQRALVAAGRAVEALLSVGDEAGAAKALSTLGNVYAQHPDPSDEDLASAIQAFERSLSLLPADDDYDRAATHMNAGKACRDLAARPGNSDVRSLIDKAHSHFEQALALSGPDRAPYIWALTLENSAHLFLRREANDRAEGRRRLITAADTALEVGALHDGLRILGALGRTWCEDSQWSEAADTFLRAAEVHERLLNETYSTASQLYTIAEGARVHTAFAYSLLKLGRVGEALERLEEGKTRLFREFLAVHGADLMMLPEEQSEELHRLRENVARLGDDGEEFVRATQELRRLTTRLRIDHPRAFPTAPRLDTILGLAADGEALVVPVVTPFGGAVVIVTAAAVTEGDVVWLPEFDSNALHGLLLSRAYAFADDENTLVRLFDSVFGSVSSTITVAYVAQNDSELASLLWTTIMGPVDERLCEGQSVVILPHGGVGMLPLHAAADGTSFLARHPVRYTPSAAALVDSKARQANELGDKRLLALADPTLDLPYAAVEADIVGTVFAPDDQTILKGSDADAAGLARHIGNATHLHLACHAVYEWDSTMDSSLVLAGGETFTLAEMAALPRLDHIRLVSLSGCETGASEIRAAADEYLGFPLALHQAGVPLVLSTLWPVSDAAAAFLMGRFYQEHLVLGLAPTHALRAAQLWLRDATRADLVAWLDEISRGARNVRMELLKEDLRDEWPAADLPFRDVRDWAAFTLSGY